VTLDYLAARFKHKLAFLSGIDRNMSYTDNHSVTKDSIDRTLWRI